MAIEVDSLGVSYYQPLAFYMSLRKDVLDPLTGAPKAHEFPAFMHEYSHRLQDTTTIYGVSQFLNFFDITQDIIRVANEREVIRVPVGRDPQHADLWMNRLDEVAASAHPVDPWAPGNWAYLRHELLLRPVSRDLTPHGQLPEVVVTFRDPTTGESCQHKLGAREVCEGYSHAVQCLQGGDSTFSPEHFEYHAVERVIESFLGPRILPESAVVLCHWALQSPFPGAELFALLEHLPRDQEWSPEALYDECRRFSLQRNLGDHVAERMRSLERIVTWRKEQGDVDGYLTKAFEWYRDVSLRGLRLLVDETRRFPLDTAICRNLADLTEHEATRQWSALVREFPVPLAEDQGTRALWSIGGSEEDVQMGYFGRALVCLVTQLRHGGLSEWPCPLHATCTVSIKDQSCLSRPNRKGEGPTRCPYGAAAFFLQVHNKTFEPLNPSEVLWAKARFGALQKERLVLAAHYGNRSAQEVLGEDLDQLPTLLEALKEAAASDPEVFARVALALLRPLESTIARDSQLDLTGGVRRWLDLRSPETGPMSTLATLAFSAADELAGEAPPPPGLTWPTEPEPLCVPWQVHYCMAICWLARFLSRPTEAQSRRMFLAKKAAESVLAALSALDDRPNMEASAIRSVAESLLQPEVE